MSEEEGERDEDYHHRLQRNIGDERESPDGLSYGLRPVFGACVVVEALAKARESSAELSSKRTLDARDEEDCASHQHALYWSVEVAEEERARAISTKRGQPSHRRKPEGLAHPRTKQLTDTPPR